MAFELLDPHRHGFIDASVLRDVLSVCVSGDSFSEVTAATVKDDRTCDVTSMHR